MQAREDTTKLIITETKSFLLPGGPRISPTAQIPGCFCSCRKQPELHSSGSNETKTVTKAIFSCLFVYTLIFCPSACLPSTVGVFSSIRLSSPCLPFSQSACLTLSLCMSLYVCLLACLPVCFAACLSIRPTFSVFVCLSVYLSTCM